MTAPELMKLVDEAAVVFEKKGENAYPEFREKGSKWFVGDTYFFAWTLDGIRAFHAANPASEGINVSNSKDVLGREWGQMFLATANTASGDGWVHYMYPEPGNIFPTWKSSYLKRVTYPSGKEYIIGCGIYNMQMDKAFIEDVVNRAAELVSTKGPLAFNELRDKTGPYVFMDVYVFVDDVHGVELVNPGQPTMEGRNIMELKDIKGKMVTKEYIEGALKHGNTWVDYYWYRPGSDKLAHKYTYAKKVMFGGVTYVVGAGLYVEDGEVKSVELR
jgi:signal transduction histidine kinase